MSRYILASVFLIGLGTPALADFFVVQNTSTKECSVNRQDKKTDDGTMVVIGTKNYQTVAEAEAKMKAAEECQAPQ